MNRSQKFIQYCKNNKMYVVALVFILILFIFVAIDGQSIFMLWFMGGTFLFTVVGGIIDSGRSI
jgi:hypothetical protein